MFNRKINSDKKNIGKFPLWVSNVLFTTTYDDLQNGEAFLNEHGFAKFLEQRRHRSVALSASRVSVLHF
ncbi:hypothetical protein RB195_022893 [Necator americanus]|uniref:Uncharacterized protein n=1 Tax=Necator americanus TaxID=51031 RepID=A0ABR1EJJ6_NECAM